MLVRSIEDVKTVAWGNGLSRRFLLEADEVVGAGVDVLMFCHQQEAAVRAFEFLHREAEKNKEIRTRMNESEQRIRRLKERFLKSPAGVCEEDLNNRIGLPEHHQIIEEIQGSL